MTMEWKKAENKLRLMAIVMQIFFSMSIIIFLLIVITTPETGMSKRGDIVMVDLTYSNITSQIVIINLTDCS